MPPKRNQGKSQHGRGRTRAPNARPKAGPSPREDHSPEAKKASLPTWRKKESNTDRVSFVRSATKPGLAPVVDLSGKDNTKLQFASPLSELDDEQVDVIISEKWAEMAENRARASSPVECQTYLAATTYQWAKTWHPSILPVNTEDSKCVRTSHPRAALERELAEMHIIATLNAECKAKPDILDAGGNPSRHEFHKRHNVSSCCPLIDSRDAARRHKRLIQNTQNWCECTLAQHMTGKCGASQPDVVMSVDSIYDISREEWLSAVAKTKLQRGAAAFHLHTKYVGSNYSGEYHYRRRGEKYHVTVKGELSPYVAKEPSWLFACSHTMMVDDVMTNFAWELRKFGEFMYTAEFFVVPDPIPSQTSEATLTIEQSLALDKHTGPITWSLHSAQVEADAPVLESESLADYKFESDMGFVLAHKSHSTVALPKELLAQALLFTSMQPRTQAIFQALNRDMRSKLVTKFAVPTEDLADVHRTLCLLGFYGRISEDAYLLSQAALKSADDIDQLSRAIKGEKQGFLDYLIWRAKSARNKSVAASIEFVNHHQGALSSAALAAILSYVVYKNRNRDRLAPASLLSALRNLPSAVSSSRIYGLVSSWFSTVKTEECAEAVEYAATRIVTETVDAADNIGYAYLSMLPRRIAALYALIKGACGWAVQMRPQIPSQHVQRATAGVVEGVLVGVAEESAHAALGKPFGVRLLHILLEWYAASAARTVYWPAAVVHTLCHFLPYQYACALHAAYNAVAFVTALAPASIHKHAGKVLGLVFALAFLIYVTRGNPPPPGSNSQASLSKAWSAWEGLRLRQSDTTMPPVYGQQQLVAVVPCKPMPPERRSDPDDPRSQRIRVRPPVFEREPASQPCLRLIGLGSTDTHPVIFTKGTASEYLAFRCRVSAERIPADENLWVSATKYLIDNISLFTCRAKLPVDVVDFATWASRFPPLRRDELLEAFAIGFDSDYTDPQFQTATAFTKVEALLKIKPEGVELTAPRMIQTFRARIVVITGPWVWSFAKAISHAAWSNGTRRTLHRVPRAYHASGATTERLGVVFEAMLAEASQAPADYVINTDDATLFDMHCGTFAHEAKLDFYEAVGAPTDVIECLRMQAAPQLRGAAGNVVDVVDGMTSTGVTDTSTGGTIINSLVNHYAYSLSADPADGYHFRMVAMADDMVSCGPKKHFTPEYYATRTALGIPYKPAQFPMEEAWRAEFCQQRPWPVLDELVPKIVWGPKPGRLMAKMPWTHLNVKASTARAMLRGNALGFYASTRHVPFAREYVDTILRLTSDTSPIFVSQGEWVFRAEAHHDPLPNDDVIQGIPYPSTWNMVYALYQLTPEDLKDFRTTLDSVKELPCTITHFVFDRLDQVDNA